MSFMPVIPASGIAGWAFLSRTKIKQEASFNAAPQLQRDAAYFRNNLASITSAQDLVSDRRLLRVALGALGLQDDLNNRAFIRKIIEGGTNDRAALANRLADKRYFALAEAFSHLAGPTAAPVPSGLIDRILTQYRAREFEVAVGAQDQTMRLALSLQRELPQIAQGFSTPSAQWFAILGNPPLREILQTAMGFPKEFGQLDIDSQAARLRAATEKRFGSSDPQELSRPETLAKLTSRFLVMSQLRESQSALNGAATALTLLQNARSSRWSQD